MRKILISLLSRLLEKDTMKPNPKVSQSELSVQLAKLYEDGIFEAWIEYFDKIIYKNWKNGTGESDNFTRGRLYQNKIISLEVQRYYEQEKKRREMRDKSLEQNQKK